jgi:hypothetical protein
VGTIFGRKTEAKLKKKTRERKREHGEQDQKLAVKVHEIVSDARMYV